MSCIDAPRGGRRRFSPWSDVWHRRPAYPTSTKPRRTLGTPTPASWPGVVELADHRPWFPKWPQRAVACVEGRLDGAGAELLARMLTCDPAARISARDALRHPYLAGDA